MIYGPVMIMGLFSQFFLGRRKMPLAAAFSITLSGADRIPGRKADSQTEDGFCVIIFQAGISEESGRRR